TRESWIEPHSHLEKMPGLIVFSLAEPIHVPQAAVMSFPRVQRGRWLQDRAIAFDRLDLGYDGRDDPVADFIEDEEGIVEFLVEDLRPDDMSSSRLGQFDRHTHALAVAAHGTAHDIVDVEHPACLLRANAPLVQCEH